jgi:hypothetical protein
MNRVLRTALMGRKFSGFAPFHHFEILKNRNLTCAVGQNSGS